ncbi:hypothetical protein ACLB0R_04290 [Sphingomonas sp. GlSt437]|uniref:hypothetical protein n=1 Tax=Sphingomonas sp. GlSt437 TaxID=3389970 RepID=UPI003A8BED48
MKHFLVLLPLTALIAPALAPAQQTVPPKAPAHKSIEVEGDGASLIGREPTGPARPTPRDAAGHPDLTGFWKPIKDGKPIGNIGRDLPGFRLPLTPEGEAALKHNLTETVDPEARCILGGIPRHDASGLPFEILQTPKRLAFLYLYSTHRFIPTDGRERDADPEPRFFGNPIGTWRGDTLVIDSTGFKDTNIWIDENANPASGEMHTIEEWTRPDAGHIHLVLTVDDKRYYTHPFTFTRTWVLGGPGEGLTEYACNENNVDLKHLGPGPGAIGPDGNRGADIPKTLPDNPPPPEFYEQQEKAPKPALPVGQGHGEAPHDKPRG